MRYTICPCSRADDSGWMALRRALFPHHDDAFLRAQMDRFVEHPERHAQFLVIDEEGAPAGLAEVSLRVDHVPGTPRTPVAFLGAIYVVPHARRRGLARALVTHARAWARAQGCTEFASDALPDDAGSLALHRALGLDEAPPSSASGGARPVEGRNRVLDGRVDCPPLLKSTPPQARQPDERAIMTKNLLTRTTLAFGLACMAPLAAWSAVSVSVTIAPPPLPLYAQPPIPGDGYIWTPGYWAWDPAAGDYVWVPGTWVLPPAVGLLWTPGYWAFFDGGYIWHRGYWGPHVGYYGGINYGYGYIGRGYDGGRWERGRFRYNTAVNNIPTGRVHNVYRAPVPQRPAHPESFNGGNSPWHSQPTASQRRFEGGQHPDWTREQQEHEHRAFGTPEQRMGSNHGMPPTAATPRPGGFGEPQVERARPAPEMRPQPVRPAPAMRPVETPHMEGAPRAQPRGAPHGDDRGHPGGNRGNEPR